MLETNAHVMESLILFTNILRCFYFIFKCIFGNLNSHLNIYISQCFKLDNTKCSVFSLDNPVVSIGIFHWISSIKHYLDKLFKLPPHFFWLFTSITSFTPLALSHFIISSLTLPTFLALPSLSLPEHSLHSNNPFSQLYLFPIFSSHYLNPILSLHYLTPISHSLTLSLTSPHSLTPICILSLHSLISLIPFSHPSQPHSLISLTHHTL